MIWYDKSMWSKIKQDGGMKDKIWYDKARLRNDISWWRNIRYDMIKQDGGM